MTGQIKFEDDTTDEEKAAQLSQIKVQADLLGVSYASNIGLETLSERVRAFKESKSTNESVEAVDAPAAKATAAIDPKTNEEIMVPADIEAQYAIFRAKQLIRVSITCVNPAKSELEADLYTIFSSSLGRVSQVIPYQAPEGHHLPRCLVDFLKEKKYVAFRPTKRRKGENGADREHFETSEFIIRELPPLTAIEFNRIVQRQDRHEAVLTEDY